MKKIIALMLLVCVGSAFASYTHEIGPGDDFGDEALNDSESLLMTGGMGHFLDLWDESSARIEDTDPLISEGNGGIWDITQGGDSTLEILGGEIHELSIGSDAYVTISGGRIDEINSRQFVGTRWIEGTDDPPLYEPDTHITFICDVDSVDVTNNLLTGNWLDGSDFSIQLVDRVRPDGVPFTPVIDNIEFIPEPATLLLVGVGGLLLRKRKS